LVNCEIAFAWAVEPAAFSVPEGQEDAEEPVLPALEVEVDDEELLSEPHALSARAAATATPATAPYR
jgi:hypothetical protein